MLLKQSSSRNLRAKGFKLKHGVQICVILAICIWLLYQVNKSYSKKGAIEGSGSEALPTNLPSKESAFNGIPMKSQSWQWSEIPKGDLSKIQRNHFCQTKSQN
nr:proline-, glutamic acid- and leucine-rich protein 1-like [Ipomoea batatas]